MFSMLLSSTAEEEEWDWEGLESVDPELTEASKEEEITEEDFEIKSMLDFVGFGHLLTLPSADHPMMKQLENVEQSHQPTPLSLVQPQLQAQATVDTLVMPPPTTALDNHGYNCDYNGIHQGFPSSLIRVPSNAIGTTFTSLVSNEPQLLTSHAYPGFSQQPQQHLANLSGGPLQHPIQSNRTLSMLHPYSTLNGVIQPLVQPYTGSMFAQGNTYSMSDQERKHQLLSLIDQATYALQDLSSLDVSDVRDPLLLRLKKLVELGQHYISHLETTSQIDIHAITKNWKLRKPTGDPSKGSRRQEFDVMMEHHKKNLEGLEGQEKAKAESKVFREAADKIGLSEATKLTHKSAIRNYLGFCIEKGYSPFVTTACGSQINLETYDSWVLWLVEPKENGKTFKYNTVKRYVSACRAWCCRHFIKYAREKKSYEAIQQMKTASKLVDVEEVQAAILPPIDIFRMLHGCDWSSEKGLRLASRMLVSFVSGARPLSLAKIQLKHLQLQPKFMNGKLQSMDVRVKIVHDKVESATNRHQTWFSGNRVGLCNIILLMQYLSKRQVFTHGTFENALNHEFIQFKKECLDEYLFSDIGKGLEPQPLENFRYELKCIAKNVGIQEEKVCPYSFRRSGATWSVGNSIIEKGSITQNDLEVIIRYYGWKFAASNEIARKYMDKRLLEFFDGAIQFMGLQSNRKWTEEDLERKFRKTPSDEPGYNYHSIRLAMPDYFKEEIAKFHQIQYNELIGENIAKAIDRWTFAKLQQLQVATSIDVKVNLVTLYRLFLHFNRIKILDQLKSLTCFHGDVSHAEMAMEVIGDDSNKVKPPQLTSEVVKGTPQLTSEVAVVTPPQLTSEVTKDTAPPSACEENRTPKDMTSLLELLQSIAQESSSNTTRVSDSPKESNINTPSGLSFNLLNHKKEERLLNSELPLPKNKHGQHVSAQLFWTSLKPGPKMKKPVRKENKRRMNEKNWEKIIPRIAMDAATLLDKYPQLVDQIKATKEYGLALDWLSEFESYGMCQRLESRLSTFPNCGYIEQFIVSVIELTNASFKIITEIWIREEIISPSTDNPRMYEINSGQLLEAQNVYSLRDVQGDEIDESFIQTTSRTVVHLDASQVTLENYEHASKDILRQFMRKKLGSISNKVINHLKLCNLIQASKTILECERDKLEIDGDALKKELAEIALKNKEASSLSDIVNKITIELTLADYKQATSNGLRSFIRSQIGSTSNDILNHLLKKEMQQIVEQLLKEKSTHEEIKSQMIDWSNANKERKKKQSSSKRKQKDDNNSSEDEEDKKPKRKQKEDPNTKQTKKSKK